jgi:hypothetical protein
MMHMDRDDQDMRKSDDDDEPLLQSQQRSMKIKMYFFLEHLLHIQRDWSFTVPPLKKRYDLGNDYFKQEFAQTSPSRGIDVGDLLLTDMGQMITVENIIDTAADTPERTGTSEFLIC